MVEGTPFDVDAIVPNAERSAGKTGDHADARILVFAGHIRVFFDIIKWGKWVDFQEDLVMVKRVSSKGESLAPLTAQSSRPRLAVVAILAVWSLLLAGLSGCVVQALPPATPATGLPGIALDPAAGPAGTLVAVQGQGWSPGSLVLITLTPPGQTEPADQPLMGVTADTQGRFKVAFVIPSAPGWERSGPAAVVARSTQGSAQAVFSVTVASEGALPAPSGPIKATDVLASSKAGEVPASGAAAPAPGGPGATAATDLNIRGGPGVEYAVVGALRTGQSAEITGVSPDGGWWQIRLLGQVADRGWVSARYVTAQNAANVPVVLPPGPPATATPAVTAGWRGEYYANRNLAETPAVVRDDPQINFDWGPNTPASDLPNDDFSVRWTRDLSFSAGTYRFYAYVDDGVRLWIDGELVIDQWHDSTPTTYTADLTLAEGKHGLRMEYYEHTGNAIARLEWEGLTSYPDWKGEYYDNPGLNGAPVLVRNDTNLDFYWSESPGPGVPADNFSARWTRTLYFPGGTYAFDLVVDDGASLWVDDQLIIDGWRSGPPEDYTAGLGLSEGPHTVRLEYFEFRYVAQVHLTITVADEGGDWEAEYFDNRDLDDDPVLERDDNFINFNWGSGSPGPNVPADDFSARWRQDVDFDEGTYTFSAWVDDGVRIFVDGNLVLDSWEEGRYRLREAEYFVSGGEHRVRVEYFDHTGNARIEVSWERQ